MKIGELSEKTGCSIETIRYYEKQELLPEPDRTAGNFRDYGQKHLERLLFIRNCRCLDMSHHEIKALLSYLDQPQQDCSGVNRLIDEHLEHVNKRIGELERLKIQLLDLQQSCQGIDGMDNCGIVKGLSSKKWKAPKLKNHIASSKELHNKES